jgi:4,5-DOPA dioxygenase extradiol
MFAVEENVFRCRWADLAARLGRPAAIVCVSAHWISLGVQVSGARKPDTIHDFVGFPRELYDIRYPAEGSPSLAGRICNLLGDADASIEPSRGLDHGAWTVLRAMYPDASVPVVQLSLDLTRSPAQHYELGARLAPLRDEGIVILASGNVVHNLPAHTRQVPGAVPWGERFDRRVRELIERGDHLALTSEALEDDDAVLSVPTAEHFLPLLYVLAVRRAGDRLTVFNEGVRGAVSMTSYLFETGAPMSGRP